MAASSDLSRPQAVALVGALVAVVALSWAPSFVAPLGDNHEGRVDGRFALHVQNLQTSGLTGSNWVSSMEPYGESYAHHPPGPNFAQAAVAMAVGQGASEVRIFPYLVGLLTLPAAAWLVRRVGLSWTAAVTSVAVLAATPLYWCFGRLLWDIPLLFVVSAAVLGARRSRPSTLVVAAGLVFATVLMSWFGAVTAAAFVLLGWFSRGSDRDRPALVVLAAAGVLAAALSGAWFLAATSTTDLAGQVEFRTTGGSFTAGEFVVRQVDGTLSLVPVWALGLAVAGAWVVRRTPGTARTVFALSTALAVGFVVGLPNGAYIHDYWIYPVLVPLALGGALATDAALQRWPNSLTPMRVGVGATAISALLVSAIAVGGVGQSYFREPEAAGRLASRTSPAPNQEVAWTANGIDTPRWLSWYWDLPARPVEKEDLAAGDADDLVLVAEPLQRPFTDVSTIDRAGGYAIVRLGDLRARCVDDPAACE